MMKGKTRMKKRWISLILVICFVIALLPTFASAARPEGNEDGFQSVGTQNWSPSAVEGWTPSSGQNAYGSAGHYLYVKVDGQYYLVHVMNDNAYYQKKTTSTNIQNTFATRCDKDGTQNGKYEISTNYYYYDSAKQEAHQLFYNVYQNGSNLTGSNQFVELYYYVNYFQSGGLVSNESSMASAVNSGEVRLIDSNGNGGKTARWPFAYGTGLWGGYSGKAESVVNLWTQSSASKKAMYYEKDGKTIYLARNLTGQTVSPWNGELFYKVDPAVWHDPETIPVDDPDPAASSQTVQNGTIINNPGRVNDNGLKLSKNLSTADGEKFDITMESYSTANTTKNAVTEKVPTDFVLVVDQSGSMSDSDMPSGYSMVSGSRTLEQIAKGSYYILGEDGNYYRVYGVKDYLFRYYPANYWYTGSLVEHLGQNLRWFMGNTEATTNFENQFYFREVVNGVTYYQPITTTVSGEVLTYYVKFHFNSKVTGGEVWFDRDVTTYSSNGVSPWYHNVINGDVMSSGVLRNTADAFVQGIWRDDNAYTFSEVDLGLAHPKTGMYINYPMYDRHVGYVELRYRDVNGVEHTVSPMQGADRAEFCDADGNAITTQSGTTRYNYNKLYQATGTTTRLNALKAAATAFANAVANEKDTKTGEVCGVDNSVAIVGYSSEPSDTRYSNTEILTGTDLTVSDNNGVQMLDATTTNYKNALVPGYTGEVGTVNPKITQAIAALTANGGTQPEYGFQMAKSILDNRTKTKYTMQTVEGNPEVDRNKIVIFFTDGQPGDYHYSNQYSEANDVVEKALPLKQDGVQIFSIGVFGQSDGDPLTYAETNLNPPYDNSDYWPYMGGWMETYTTGGRSYCLRRQWRPNNAEGYTEKANDTIFDYMSVTSSNYPDATDYIAPTWLTGGFQGNYIAATEGVRGTGVEGNQFYRMAANQDTLVAAFTQAVTHAGSINSVSTSIILDETSVFKDTVNTEDWDVSNATYTVYKQAIHVDDTVTTGSMVSTVGDPQVIQSGLAVPTDGVITYSGFDYQNSYVAYGHPDGFKLIVKVEGLEPKTFGTEVKTNADTETLNACGIYEYGKDVPAISIASPTATVLKSGSSYVADYNAPLIVATDVTQDGITEKNVTNGDFTRNADGEAVYKLSSQALSGKTAVVNGAYAAVDSAKINGKHVEDGAKAKVQNRTVYVVPASSVYYSDKLDTAVTVGDGSGYNAELADQIGTAASQSAENVTGTFYFTFYGTGIDVYCTTHDNGGFVSAAVFTGSGESACVKANRVGSAKTVREYSAGNYYNTPAVFFDGLTAGTYTLKIVANDNAQFKLDGVRVYNPVQAGSAAETELNKTDEANATYLNLRKVLLNDDDGKDVFTVENNLPTGDVDPSAVSGVLFINDVSSVVTTSNWYKDEGATEATFHDEPGQIYQSQFDVYKANGPKNEIYLNNGQAVTFQLNTSKFDENTKVYIGLSAPVSGSGDVVINGEEVDPAVTTVMDMYYPIDIDLEQAENNSLSITVENAGSGIISVTNLKITGVANLIPAANANNDQDILNATRALFAPVTMKTVRMAVNKGIDPEADTVEPEDPAETEDPKDPAVTEDPEETEKPDDGSLVIDEPEETVTPAPTPSVTPDKPAETGNTIQKVIQSITKSISSFFKSIFRR